MKKTARGAYRIKIIRCWRMVSTYKILLTFLLGNEIKKPEMIMKFWEPRYQTWQKDTCHPLLVCFLAWAISSNSLSVRLFQSNQVSWSWIDLDWARQNFINMGEWDQHQTNFPLFFSRFDKELEDMTMIHYQSWSHTFLLVPFLKLGFIHKPWENMLRQYSNAPIMAKISSMMMVYPVI